MPQVVERRHATYDDLLKVPDHLVAELIDGELYTSPRPGFRHTNASSSLGGEIHLRFQRGEGGPGGWVIFDEPELHLGDDVLVPDIAGWRRERMPAIPDTAWTDIAPDWICEIVSPGTSRLDRALKLPRYARYQISYAWIVDPNAKTLEVYERDGNRFALSGTYAGSVFIRAEPFDACELNLGALWID